MIKAKEFANVIVSALVLGAAVSLYMISHRGVSQAPAFVYDEIVVNKVAAAKTVSAPKAAVQPANPVAVIPPIVSPRVLSRVLPEYPATAIKQGIEGVVMVEALIGANGRPETVTVKSTSGNTELDASAARAVSQWTFSAASQGGAALSSVFEVPVRFALK